MKKKILHASVYLDPSEIVSHFVGRKDVRVLSYARRGPAGEITIEQATPALVYRACEGRAWVKDRPVVSYADPPFGGVPITLRWRKHRLCAPTRGAPSADLVPTSALSAAPSTQFPPRPLRPAL